MKAHNPNRMIFLDALRIVAMFAMVQGHSIDALGDPKIFDVSALPWSVWGFIRGFTAPIFLIVSGIVQVYANKIEDGKVEEKSVFSKRINMALILVFIGYLLMFSAENIFYFFDSLSTSLPNFTIFNILQLIGTCLIISNILFRKIKSIKILLTFCIILSACFLFISSFLTHIPSIFKYDYILTNMITYEKGSLFPLFPAAFYYFFGVFIGLFFKLKNIENKELFIKKYFPIAGILLLAVSHLLISEQYHTFNEYLLSYTKGFLVPVISRTGIVLMFIAFFAAIAPMFDKSKTFIINLATRALWVYIAHLMIIFGTPLFKSFNYYCAKKLQLMPAIGIAVLVEILAFAVVLTIDYIIRTKQSSIRYFKYTMFVYLLLVLFLRK